MNVTHNGKQHRPAHSSGGMTEAQRSTLRIKQREGFALVAEEHSCVVIRNGNNYQLILKDGTAQRAHGAKR
jgi:hypothetical protein